MNRRVLTLIVLVLVLTLGLGSAVVAATVPAGELGSRKLSEGMTGTDVTQLQTLLKERGFFTGIPDGSFGASTRQAVMAYQGASRVLYPYGVADFATIRYMKNNPGLAAGTLGARRLSAGMTGADVRALQELLVRAGLLSGDASGTYDSATEGAVRRYQAESKTLYAYGVADFATIRHMVAANTLKVAMLIPGNINDGGFMQAGYNGLLKIEKELGAITTYIDGKQPVLEELAGALRQLAAGKPDLIIAHGGQCSPATQLVAAEFPEIRFVVVQGNVTGDNLSSYEVLQEESTWLAGAAAGLLTETNVVGHISGIRVVPGLKGRGAFADGLKYTNPDATFLTNFCGYQDDNEISRLVAEAEIEAGADIIFTMLNAGRQGATDVMKEAGAFHIGNVVDWIPLDPDVYIGSAVANVSIAGFEAARDLYEGTWKPGVIEKIGLENPDAVRLTLNPKFVPADVVETIEELARKIESGEIRVNTDYQGPEFEVDLPR